MITFVTFGGPTKEFNERIKIICGQAHRTTVFDKIYGFNQSSLIGNNSFWEKHGEFIKNNKRGYGYWLWKPFIIQKMLSQMNEGDYLVYADAGCTVNYHGVPRFREYIDLLDTNEEKYGVLSFQMTSLPEYKYTKRAVFDALDADEIMRNSDQCMATVLLIKKNEHSQSFVDRWYELASTYSLLDDSKSPDEHPGFIDHRHDQSIYSCLCKKMGSVMIKDETFYYPKWENGKNFPFWATRYKTATRFERMYVERMLSKF